MSSEQYHEPLELLSQRTIELHRALVSLIEELEAIDWYEQRAEACTDPELKSILLHHKNEEVEHAIMNLEWIRRRDAHFDENCRTYLFSEGSITRLEAAPEESPRAGATGTDGTLGVGSLKLNAETA